MRSSVDDIVIHIHSCHCSAATHHLDIAQTTHLAHTSSLVQCVEHGRERRQGVCAWACHLSHNIHLYCPYLSEAHLHVCAQIDIRRCQARVYLAQFGLDTVGSSLHSQSVHIHGAHIRNRYISVWTHLLGDVRLTGSPHLNLQLVARPQSIVHRCGDVHARFEGQIGSAEDVTSEHLYASLRSVNSHVVALCRSLVLSLLRIYSLCIHVFVTLFYHGVFLLLFILVLNTLQLRRAYTSRHNFLVDSLLRLSLIYRVFHVAYHLIVAHCLRIGATSCQ